MNYEQGSSQWSKVSGEMKKKWGKLTDEDIKQSQMSPEILAGRLVERYGQKKEEALCDAKHFFSSAT